MSERNNPTWRCRNCKYWHDLGGADNGVCMRFPPAYVDHNEWLQPLTDGDNDGCGEWQGRTAIDRMEHEANAEIVAGASLSMAVEALVEQNKKTIAAAEKRKAKKEATK